MARSKNWPTLLNHAHLSNAELEDTLVAGINFQPKGLPSPLFPTTQWSSERLLEPLLSYSLHNSSS